MAKYQQARDPRISAREINLCDRFADGAGVLGEKGWNLSRRAQGVRVAETDRRT